MCLFVCCRADAHSNPSSSGFFFSNKPLIWIAKLGRRDCLQLPPVVSSRLQVASCQAATDLFIDLCNAEAHTSSQLVRARLAIRTDRHRLVWIWRIWRVCALRLAAAASSKIRSFKFEQKPTRERVSQSSIFATQDRSSCKCNSSSTSLRIDRATPQSGSGKGSGSEAYLLRRAKLPLFFFRKTIGRDVDLHVPTVFVSPIKGEGGFFGAIFTLS